MNKINNIYRLCFILFLLTRAVFSQTIEEKLQKLQMSRSSEEEFTLNNNLKKAYEKYRKLGQKLELEITRQPSQPEFIHYRTEKLKESKKEIVDLLKEWKKIQQSKKTSSSPYISLEQNMSLEELILQHPPDDCVLIIPHNIGSIPIHLGSLGSIPEAAWDDVISTILSEYQIEQITLHPCIKKLDFVSSNFHSSTIITDNKNEIDRAMPNQTIFYLMPCKQENKALTLNLLQQFRDPNTTQIFPLRESILITALKSRLQKLIELIEMVEKYQQNKQTKIISLTKISSHQAKEILFRLFFPESFSSEDTHKIEKETDPLFFSLDAQTILILGTSSQNTYAENTLVDIEKQIQDPQAKILFQYACKYTQAKELAPILNQVYHLMKNEPVSFKPTQSKTTSSPSREKPPSKETSSPYFGEKYTIDPWEQENHSPKSTPEKEESNGNFIVDTKTNALIMVIESHFLSPIKTLLKKIDIPKKMVRIDVILFEKKMMDDNRFGLNLLRIGSDAKHITQTSFDWIRETLVGNYAQEATGIGSFLFSRNKTKSLPAYDFAYKFLLSQNNIKINSNPSLTTINQTPAQIRIVEEQSIDVGIINTEAQNPGQTFKRAEYGITIKVTPTIHFVEDSLARKKEQSITLKTDIVFDTTKPSKNERPNVIRRHIQNEVRIQDGQTVIIGGLKRKNTDDENEMIPFLGEIPGIGKLFSYKKISDENTEMFIFLTPHIIDDPDQVEGYTHTQIEPMRPGESSDFFDKLNEAKEQKKKILFEKTLKMLWDK